MKHYVWICATMCVLVAGACGGSDSAGTFGASGTGGKNAGGSTDAKDASSDATDGAAGSHSNGGAAGAAGSGGAAGGGGTTASGGAGGTTASGGAGGAGAGAGGAGGTGGAPGCPKPCDCDNDNHNAAGGLCGGDDCDDTDANVYPGQIGYFPKPAKNGTFDYDCSGTVEKKYGTVLNCVIALCPAGQGYFGAAPACGSAADWGVCSGGLCNEEVLEQRTQTCH